MKTIVAAALMALAAFPAQAATRARYLMGTVCEVTAASDAEIDAAFAEATRIESFLSTWRDDSELSRLNRGDVAHISPELRSLLQRTRDVANETGGAFNPLVGALIDTWKTREAGALPSRAALEAARARTAIANLSIDGERVLLANGAAIEEGGFGKGYAIDRMLTRVESKHALINFGGQIAVRGTTSVTVADPERRDRPVLAFTLRDASLSTSSGSEKQFEAGGRRFSHIIDPRSGEALPPRGSVSIVAPDALTADILSTALYVMGQDEGLRWADRHGVAAIFISPTRNIRLSNSARTRLRDVAVLDRKFKLED